MPVNIQEFFVFCLGLKTPKGNFLACPFKMVFLFKKK